MRSEPTQLLLQLVLLDMLVVGWDSVIGIQGLGATDCKLAYESVGFWGHE